MKRKNAAHQEDASRCTKWDDHINVSSLKFIIIILGFVYRGSTPLNQRVNKSEEVHAQNSPRKPVVTSAEKPRFEEVSNKEETVARHHAIL